MCEPSETQRTWAADSKVMGPRFDPRPEPPPRLVVFGAVPLTAALTAAARAIGWTPFVVDPRPRLADPARFPAAERVLHLWPTEAFAEIGPPDADTAVVALTHAPELDDPAIRIALASPAFYVGAMGSRRTQSRRRERLAALGVPEGALDRCAGPCGLDLGGRTIEESALAILAEAVAARHGRAGGRLSDSDASIHAGPRP